MTNSLLKISKSINFDLASIFNHWFIFSSVSHRYDTSFSSKGFLEVNFEDTKTYGREVLINITVLSCNDIQKNFRLIKCYVIFLLLN